MRNLKKLFGDDLFKLALLLSLLQVDPSSYLGQYGGQGYQPLGDQGGDLVGQTWAQTQSMLPDPWMSDIGGFSPRLHPKSLDSLLESHQQEILEDLNSLGRYNRLTAYSGVPVHISAYIVDTEHNHGSCDYDQGSDSDSGISDTVHDDSEEDEMENVEKEKNPTDDEYCDMECETILDDFVDPDDVIGLESIIGLTPPPDDDLMVGPLDIGTGQDALEAELVHIDEQLMHIEDDLGHIDEAFIMMDQQLAESISDDVMYDNDVFNNYDQLTEPEVNLDNLGIDADLDINLDNNPFDDWQRESHSDIADLVFDNVGSQELQNLPSSSMLNVGEEDSGILANTENNMIELLNDPDLFPTDEAMSGSAVLEDFDDDLLEVDNHHSKHSVQLQVDRLVKNDVILSQMPLKCNASQPYRPSMSTLSLSDIAEEPENDQLEGTILPDTESEEDDDKELSDHITVDQLEVDEEDEDLIMQVLRESDIDFGSVSIDINDDKGEVVKVIDIVKDEDIKEEVIEVEEVSFDLNLADGATAKIEIDYDKLHNDIKSSFLSFEDGSEVAELSLDPLAPQPHDFNALAFENDHNYLSSTSMKLEPSPTTSGGVTGNRRRNESESSGYSSMTETTLDASASVRCRDEKLAKKMKLPFSVWEIINNPVDTFSDMLTRPGLTSAQSQACRDIRRRGKNKVAAQNCRKRKLDTIDELQSQVDQVRRRKEQLLKEREALETERARWSSKLSFIEQGVLAGLGKDLGMFTLELSDTGIVVRGSTSIGYTLLGAVGGADDGGARGGRSRT